MAAMIETLHLFRPLNDKLVGLLKSLSASDWDKKTVAGDWTVKDVTAHLLDGSMRFIAIHRDQATLKPDRELHNYGDVVSYLNQLNADWVRAMKRVSPRQLIDLHIATHEDYICGLESLPPHGPAMFSVAWAGEEVSANWFHIARDFTEKWHHQQQIRHAVNSQGILTAEYYKPVLDTFMRALPFRYKNVAAPDGTGIRVIVESPIEGSWHFLKSGNVWTQTQETERADVTVSIPAEISWQLFTKAVRYADVKGLIGITGDESLAMPLLQMITVMA